MEKYRHIPELIERLQYIRKYRQESPVDRIRKTADTPFLFTQNRQPTAEYILIPRVSSEKRRYLPIGFLPPEVIASDSAVIVNHAGLSDFGLLCSSIHMAWMRTVCGRLKSDYRYSPSVYYNFPFPTLTAEEKTEIENTAAAILEARQKYREVSLADLYGENMYLYPELQKAHRANDRAVLAAYHLAPDTPEPALVAHLFARYAALTTGRQDGSTLCQ